MKKLFTLIAALLFAATVWAQSGCPQRMSYQAVVRNAANELVTSTAGIQVTIEITDGTVFYRESHTVNSNQNGLISLMVGTGTGVTGTMEGMDWPNATFKTTVTVPGESAVEATTTVEAVPYALYACDINPDGVNITKIVTDINNHIEDTLNNYYTKNETDNKFLTINGLCDSIKNNCSGVALRGEDNTFSDKNTFTDTVYVNNGAVKADGSIAATDSLRAVNAKDLVTYTSNAIHDSITNNVSTMLSDSLENYLTIDGLCDSIKKCEVITSLQTDTVQMLKDLIKAFSGDLTNYYTKSETDNKFLTINGLCDSIENCANVALRNADNTFSDKNTFTDTVYVNNGAVKADGSIATTDSLRAVNAKDLVTYTSNAIHDSITNNVSTMLSDSLENYLTIDGLCDSIKNCEVIKTIEGDITTIEGKITTIEGSISTIEGSISTIESDITTIKKDYLTIDGLCDSIKNNCSDVALRNADNTFSDKNTFTDTVYVNNGAVQADGSIATTDSLRAVNATDLVNYTNNFLTIDGLCDSIKNCEVITALQTDTVKMLKSLINSFSGDLTNYYTKNETDNKFLTIEGLCDSIENCANVALRNADNTFDTTNIFTDTVIVENGAVQPGGSIDTKDSLRAVNAKDLVIYTDSLIDNTFSGLCDSIKNCEVIKTIEGDITTIEGEITTIKGDVTTIGGKVSTIEGDITTIKTDYLTIDGLCDSIENCANVALRGEENTFTEKNIFSDTVIVENGAVKEDGSIDTKDSLRAVNATDLVNYTNNFLTIDGLCDSIENCANVALRNADNTFTEKNTFSDTVNITGTAMVPSILDNDGKLVSTVGKDSCQMAINYCDMKNFVDAAISDSQVSQENADWDATSGVAEILNKPTTLAGYGITDASINTSTNTITLGSNSIVVPEIPSNNTTADNLCEQIESCDNVALRNADNTFTGENTFSDNTTFTDTVVVPNVIESDSTFAATDASQAVNALDVQKYVAKAVTTLEKQTSFKVASATANQTAFTLTIPAGYTSVNSDTRLVQLYINGVYVGDNVDGVVTVSGTAVTYVPANNDGYALVAGDRVQIVYWVKK